MSTTNTANGTPRKPPVEIDLPLSAIVPSPRNVRKHFDPAEITDLAANIKLHGVLVRVLVWQPDRRKERYELIDGEKRLRATKEAGLPTIPAKILDTDAQGARELMLISTVQRSNPTDAELADSFAELVEEHGYTAETIVERIGLPISRVRELIKIGRQLPKVAREALDQRRISLSTAGLIARVPGEQAREECARWAIAGDERGHYGYREGKPPTEKQMQKAVKDGVEPLNFVQTRELIGERYMVQLKQAPFSTADAELVPKAGSCQACPKRTGNAPDDYPDSRADVCTDPSCYAAKLQAHADRQIEKHRALGRKVLTGKSAAKLFNEYNPGTLGHEARQMYVDLGDTCYDVPGNQGWKKLVGAQLENEITVAVDAKGGVHELVPNKRALEILRKDHRSKARTASTDAYAARTSRENAARRMKAMAGKAAAHKANGLVAERAEAIFKNAADFTEEDLGRLRALVRQAVDFCWSEASRAVEVRRGAIAAGDHRDGGRSRGAVADLVDKAATAVELLGILAELVAARASLNWGNEYYGGDMKAGGFWAAWGIDPKKLREQALKEKAEAKANKGKKKSSPKAPDAPDAPEAAKPAGQIADWLDRGEDRGLGQFLLNDVRAVLDRLRNAPPAESKFRIGLRVKFNLDGRTGRISGSQRKPGKPDLWYIEWDLGPGETKQGAGYFGEDKLTLLPDEPPSRFKLGARVTLARDPGRIGEITCISHRGGDAEQCFVRWEIWPGERRQKSEWLHPADLVAAKTPPAPEPAWRSINPATLDVKANTRRYLTALGYTTLGKLYDWLTDPAAVTRPPGKMREEILAAIEIHAGADVKTSKADQVAKRNAERKCRVCGCTDGDCRQCIEATGHPCTWVEEDLCSRCAEEEALGKEMEAAHA